MLLPDKFEIIPHDVYSHFCTKFQQSTIRFCASVISHEDQIWYYLQRENFSFNDLVAAIFDFLAFPYAEYETNSIITELQSQVLARLGSILETIDAERGKSYVSDFISQMVNQAFEQLSQKPTIIELSTQDIESRNPIQHHNNQSIIELDAVNVHTRSYISPEDLKVLDKVKHHLIFLHKLGIIDYLKNNYQLENGKPIDEYKLADILATISRYISPKDTGNMRAYLNQLKNSYRSFITDQAEKRVDIVIQELGIIPKN